MHPSFLLGPDLQMVDSEPALASSPAFEGWVEHATRDRVSSDTMLHQLLRAQHPDHHITRALASQCDLVGFAEAGHAAMTADRSRGYDAIRKYIAPKPQHGGEDDDSGGGKLDDEVRFAAWRYEWQGTRFLVYYMSHRDYFLSRTFRFFYVLAPPSIATRADSEGHHPTTDALLLAAGKWAKTMHDEIWVYDAQQWSKSKELYRSVRGASWDDVILEPAFKSSLVRDVESFFDSRAMYETLRIPWKRGIILHGPPGNGKTISIKALINSLAARDPPVPAMYVKSLDGCAGPKESIHDIFANARVAAPCLLIFEDLDSLVEEQTRSYFLNEVDGLDSNDGILMIGSTNHLAALDAAITKRPSRFDRKYHFNDPDLDARIAYCRYWRHKLSGSSPAAAFPDDACAIIAQLTDGFSFAYMKELFITTLLTLMRESCGDKADDETASNASSTVVVAKHEPAVPGEDEADKAADRGDDAAAGKQRKRTMPTVAIPDGLQDNAFLAAALTAAKTLWEQMDSEEEDTVRLKKAATKCYPNMASLMRRYAPPRED